MVILGKIVWTLLIGRTDAAASLRDQASFIKTGFNTKDRVESAETRHP